MAPEVNSPKVGYTSKADIWSLGITVSYMLFGSFYYNVLPDIERKASFKLYLGKGRLLSLACLSFVECCLQLNPDNRSNANELLMHCFLNLDVTHPWMIPDVNFAQKDDLVYIDPTAMLYTNYMTSSYVPPIFRAPMNFTMKSLLYRYKKELDKI
jgi:serine/threonine protein kinase